MNHQIFSPSVTDPLLSYHFNLHKHKHTLVFFSFKLAYKNRMFRRSLFAIMLAALHISSTTVAAAGSTGGPAGCVTFDMNWNLLAFGFNGKDYNAGTQDTWSSSTGRRRHQLYSPAKVLTLNLICRISDGYHCSRSTVSPCDQVADKFFDLTLYSNCTDHSTLLIQPVTSPKYELYFFSPETLSNFFGGLILLSTQTPSMFLMQIAPTHLLSIFTMPPPNHGLPNKSYQALLILQILPPFWTMIPMCFVRCSPFYLEQSLTWPLDAYSNAHLFSLDMALLKAANATPIPWVDVQNVDLSNDTSGTPTPGANTAGYQPVIALAQNHVQFLDVSGLAAGSVKIFVIHCMFSTLIRFALLKYETFSFLDSYMQPTPQPMGNFPNTHGKTASFFQQSDVQQEFAFIPDDGSATYVVNVEVSFSVY